MKPRFSVLSVRNLTLCGAAALGLAALVSPFADRRGPVIPPAPPGHDDPGGRADHATIPLFDVLIVGESSVVVTNPGGWTREQVVTYLRELKKARAKGALASVGIPAPSKMKGYDAGIIYLVDGHPDSDQLAQFVRKEPPGYERIAPAVRGLYRWPPDRLVLGFRGGTELD